MINTSKITNLNADPQVAGLLPSDSDVEFAGIKSNKTVIWLQNGCSHYFTDLPLAYFNLLKKEYLKDHKAQRFLKQVAPELLRQVELFTYYNWGAADSTPDIKNGQLMPCENFRDNPNCPSLLWESKYINIGNHILTPRQLVIIDLMAKDLPDKGIAATLGISPKTLDNHKQKLFKDLEVNTKLAVITKAFQYKVVA